MRWAVERYYRRIGEPAASAAELAKGYSGHSGRVGFVVSAAEAHASDTASRLTSASRAAHRLKGVGV